MTVEDQVVALFAEANPVPSLDLLDPIEPIDMHHLINRPERSSEVIDLSVEERESRAPRRRRLAPVLALGMSALVGLALLIGPGSGVASPETVAHAHMEARADLDVEAALTLFAEDGTMLEEGFGLDDLPGLWAWYRVIGWDWVSQGCELISSGEGGVLVRCGYSFVNDLTRALDHPAVTGELSMLVSEGRVAHLVSFLDILQFSDVWETFVTWIAENHPDDLDSMYVPGVTNPLLDDESIALWDRYVEEFVVEHQD